MGGLGFGPRDCGWGAETPHSEVMAHRVLRREPVGIGAQLPAQRALRTLRTFDGSLTGGGATLQIGISDREEISHKPNVSH